MAAGVRSVAVDSVAGSLLLSDSDHVVTLTVGPLLRQAGLTVDEVLQVKRVLQVRGKGVCTQRSRVERVGAFANTFSRTACAEVLARATGLGPLGWVHAASVASWP